MTPTVNAHPTGWCAQCGDSWSLDSIAVNVAHVTICEKCADLVTQVVADELERRNGEKPKERRE